MKPITKRTFPSNGCTRRKLSLFVSFARRISELLNCLASSFHVPQRCTRHARWGMFLSTRWRRQPHRPAHSFGIATQSSCDALERKTFLPPHLHKSMPHVIQTTTAVSHTHLFNETLKEQQKKTMICFLPTPHTRSPHTRFDLLFFSSRVYRLKRRGTRHTS